MIERKFPAQIVVKAGDSNRVVSRREVSLAEAQALSAILEVRLRQKIADQIERYADDPLALFIDGGSAAKQIAEAVRSGDLS